MLSNVNIRMPDDAYLQYRIPVPSEFHEVFTHFYFAENTTTEAVQKVLLPHFQTILVFRFGAEVTMISNEGTAIMVEKSILLGPLKKAFQYTIQPGGQILVANFKDDGFYRFFGSAHLENIPFDPDALLGENCFTFLWHQISALPTPAEKVQTILDFCKPYLTPQSTISKLLSSFDDTTQNPIKAIADTSQLTERAIQYQHKKRFGFTAKEKIRYERFLKAIQFLQSTAEKISWFDVIAHCGYYDQSQLIHDFQHYLELSPKQYLKFQQEICGGNS